jgi:hypothetical protein
MTDKKNDLYYLLLLLIVSCAIKVIMIQYALPFETHVDETGIIKDPLKIIMQYKEGSFQTSTNLFNHLLVFWHGITFVFGLLTGHWNNISEYLDKLSVDDASVILSFRIFVMLLTLLGTFMWLKLFKKILPSGFANTFVIPLLFILNPVEINTNNYVKFDGISFLFYALEFYYGYSYFIEKKQKLRKYIYLITFLSMAVRIENIAFLIGYSLMDFGKCYRYDFKKYLNKEWIRTVALSIFLYSILTLNFLNLFKVKQSASYTSIKTFEEGIISLVRFSEMSYSYYLKLFLALFTPVFLLLIFLHFKGYKIAEVKNKFYFLVIPFLIVTLLLTLVEEKNVHYYLASSCFIVFTGLATVPYIKSKLLRNGILLFLLIYFATFDIQELYLVSIPPPNKEVREYILNHTNLQDTLVFYGISDLRILNTPKTIAEQIKALEETGGSTGIGLRNMLKSVSRDSSESRNFYIGVTDFFWMNSKYKNKWLIGRDSVRLRELAPAYIIIFERLNQSHKTDLPAYPYINRNYYSVYNKSYDFADSRLNYKNFYYFHSATIYKRK